MTDEAFLTEAKNFLRIDHDDDDVMLNMFRAAGDAYMKNAGVTVDYSNALYQLAVMLYMGIHYNTRDGSVQNNARGAQKVNGFSYAMQSILLQLKTE